MTASHPLDNTWKMQKPMRQEKFVQEIARELFAVNLGAGGVAFLFALWGWQAGHEFVSAFPFWIFVFVLIFNAVYLLRLLYLPIQYFRHRSAQKTYERLEQKLASCQRDELGFPLPGEANRLFFANQVFRGMRDPRTTVWWRW